MTRSAEDRLRVLLKRIDDWENEEDEYHCPLDLDRAEELILDIKQCLESILLEAE